MKRPGGPSAESLDRFAAERKRGSWTCRLQFYGSPRVIAAHLEDAKDRFRAVVSGATFQDGELLRFPLTQEQLDRVHKVAVGIPNMSIFSIGARTELNPSPSDGHLWFSPVIPKSGEAVLEAQRVFMDAFARIGRPSLVSPFTTPATWMYRAFIFIMAFPISRTNVAQNQRSREVFRELVKVAAQHGWGEYRTAPAFHVQRRCLQPVQRERGDGGECVIPGGVPPADSDYAGAVRQSQRAIRFLNVGDEMGRILTRGLVAVAMLVTAAASPATQSERTPAPASSVSATPPKLAAYKQEVAKSIDGMYDLAQQMVDSVFSFSEIGFQEYETQRYVTGILEREGFTIQRGVAGIPTAWTARFGSGKPVIALGSDIDGIPQASQKPGVAYRDPIVDGAPGHGEGHNSGVPLNIVAAIAVKRIMQREKLPGTLVLWPGVAEELLATKAYYVRAGLFKDVDVVLYNHVGTNLTTNWGDGAGNGLVSVEYTFQGESAHSGNAPWRGRSAMDAVELMNVGWNYRREHLRIQQRSHYVVTNGGDQPNVVPRNAAVWYYLRETMYPDIKRMWETADKIAQGAALMTDTTVSSRVLGSAWPIHSNKVLAETHYANIKAVGLPTWTEADITLAKAVQRELNVPEVGLATEIPQLRGREAIPDDEKRGGGSDDIGDISWNVPTVTLNFPANFQAGPGHNWANAIAMATPIAHKGVVAGAKVQAMTTLDVLMRPEIVTQAWDYFRNVQAKNVQYAPLIRPQDTPAIWLNEETMAKYRPELRKHYYDPTKYKTYLDQLGINYPTLR